MILLISQINNRLIAYRFKYIYLYTNTVLDVTSVCPSVILSVRYRNHFPVVRFQNRAHIWNPHGTGHVCKTIWGTEGAPIFFFLLLSFTAAEGSGCPNGRRWRPNGGAEGAQRWHRRRHAPGGRGKSRRSSLVYIIIRYWMLA